MSKRQLCPRGYPLAALLVQLEHELGPARDEHRVEEGRRRAAALLARQELPRPGPLRRPPCEATSHYPQALSRLRLVLFDFTYCLQSALPHDILPVVE